MNKHTPGPWLLMTVPTSVGSCHKIGPFPNGDRSATFACVYADGHRLGVDDANPAAVELAANARLIAAAPDLLEALQRFLDYESAMNSREDVSGMLIYAEFSDMARAVVAKATGEST